MSSSASRRGAPWIAAAGIVIASGSQDAPAHHVDAPLLRISCDELPLKLPTPLEARDDERERPYHALVRVWSFPDRTPLDVPIERVNLLGAASATPVGTGEFLFSGIAVGYTAVSLLSEAPAPGVPRVAVAPGRRSLAGRNPLVLARHAITVCDLFVPDEAALDRTIALKGIVVDRADGDPIEGATIACAATKLRSGSDGRFAFEAPVAWRALLTQTAVSMEGYRPFVMNPLGLNAVWIDRLRNDGEAVFTLAREVDEKPSGPLPHLVR